MKFGDSWLIVMFFVKQRKKCRCWLKQSWWKDVNVIKNSWTRKDGKWHKGAADYKMHETHNDDILVQYQMRHIAEADQLINWYQIHNGRWAKM